MVTIKYSHGSSRARKARLAKRLGKNTQYAEAGLVGVLAAASIYLLATHYAIGRSVLGLDIFIGIALLWQRWDIGELGLSARSLSGSEIQLDRVLEPDLLAAMKPSISAAELWVAAVHQWQGIFVATRTGVPLQLVADLMSKEQVPVEAIWQAAVARANQMQAHEIDGGLVVAAILLDIPAVKPLLTHAKIKAEDVLSVLEWQWRSAHYMAQEKHKAYYGGIGRDWASGYTPLLSQFAENISLDVELGYRHTAANLHSEATDTLLQLLNENQPVALVGAIGSGRTSLVYAAAERILTNTNVGGLRYYQIMALNASALITADGQIEETLTNLLAEGVQAKNTIIFLDEANLFLSSGPGSVDISRILLPILQRKAVKIVLAMTDHDWQALGAAEPALAGQLQRITVPEPSEQAVVAVLQDESIKLEYKAQAVTRHDAIIEAIKLANRYLPEMALPGKAITVLDSAGYYAENGIITAASVQQAVRATTGAKVTAASGPEREQLLHLEEQIHKRMINQTRAVTVVSEALRRARAGVASEKRPVGSFLFLGPTGVGKTELAKALAAVYFGGEQQIIRLDMSEYQQSSDINRLLAPGTLSEAGSTLVSQVRQSPSSVILLDEIEKAHPDILNLLLQLLDEGHLTDSGGRPVSFRDAIIIATSNASADEIRERIEKGQKLEDFEAEITEQLITSHEFKPELLNRFDEIVLFRPLTKEELAQVVGLMMAEVNATLKSQSVAVALTPAAAAWLVDHGYDPKLGARPLRRMVQRTVENIVAQRLLAETLTAGDTLTLDAADLAPHAPAPGVA